MKHKESKLLVYLKMQLKQFDITSTHNSITIIQYRINPASNLGDSTEP